MFGHAREACRKGVPVHTIVKCKSEILYYAHAQRRQFSNTEVSVCSIYSGCMSIKKRNQQCSSLPTAECFQKTKQQGSRVVKQRYMYTRNKSRSIYIAPLDPLLPFPSATFSSLPQRTRSLPTWKTTEANLNGSFAVPLSS